MKQYTPEEYDRMIKYAELVIAKDKSDLLNKLAQIGRSMSDEELKAMVDMVNKKTTEK